MKIEVKPRFRNIIYSLPNERKISVKTELNFKMKLYSIGEIELVEDFKEIEDIQVKKSECNINNVILQKESIIASREDVMYEENITGFYEILKAVPYIVSAEYKKSYNKLMIKGDMLIDLVYLNTSNIAKKIRLNLPFSGVIEVDELKDEHIIDIDYNIMDFNITPNLIDGALKSFEVGYKVGAKVTIYEIQKRSIIEDFYSEQLDFKVDSNKCEALLCTEDFSKYVDIREEIVNVIMDGYKIIDYTILKENLIASVVNNNALISGSVKVILLLQNEEKRAIESKTIEIKIDENIQIDNKNNDVEGYITLDRVNITENNNNVEVKFRINFKGKILNISNFECINSIESIDGENSDIDSIYMYVVKKDDTLWSIAKKYKTTVDKIVKVNNIENKDLINIGQKLLIIR